MARRQSRRRSVNQLMAIVDRRQTETEQKPATPAGAPAEERKTRKKTEG